MKKMNGGLSEEVQLCGMRHCVLVFLACLALPVGAAESLSSYRTGLLEPTEDSEALLRDLVQPVTAVRRNELGWQRLLDRMDADVTPFALDAEDVASRGKEFVVQAPMPLSFRATTDELPPPPQSAGRVDNSELDAFPPIRSQGGQGSCSAFSSTYYQMTHNTALARGWNARTGGDSFRFSPKWTYNMSNGGEDAGAHIASVMSIAAKHGAARWSEFPYNTGLPHDATAWCLDSNVWLEALSCRMNAHYLITNVHNEGGLALVKTALDNGYVLGFESYSPWGYQGWKKGVVGDDPATTNDTPYVGQEICLYVVSQDWGHAMTIVGYNDDIWCDLNGNGIVDPGEKGALKIANSWGTGWGNGGYAWFAYDALGNVTAVENGPSATNRVYGFGWGGSESMSRVFVTTAQPSYEPTLVGYFTLRHAKRSQMLIGIGSSETNQTIPSRKWSGSALSFSGGPLAFDGSSGPAVAATFFMDFSDLEPEPGEIERFYLEMTDTPNDSHQGEIIDFGLIDYSQGGKVYYVSPGMNPGSFNPSTGYANGSTARAFIDLNVHTGRITRVAPSAGITDGGFLVVIQGEDLGDGTDVTGVTLCGVDAGIQSQSATQVVVIAGAATLSGAGAVLVVSSSMGTTRAGDAFAYLVPASFTLRAVALEDAAVLRWSDPRAAGFSNQHVNVRYSTGGYPADPDDGESIYTGIDLTYTHTNLLHGTTYYYSAWCSHDGVHFVEP